MQAIPKSPWRRPRALRARAKPHARTVLPLLVLAGLLGCGDGSEPGGPRAAASSAAAPQDVTAARERLERLVELFQPPDPLATSNRHDQQLADQRRFREEVAKQPDEAFGRLALERFRSEPEDAQVLRVELLRAAAHGLPGDEASDLLEHIVLTYDAETGYGVRGQAVGIWADVAPADLTEVLRPILAERRHRRTLPPDEELLRAWVRSARAVGRPGAEIEEVLAEIAVNIYQDDATRHLAIAELAESPDGLGAAARRALEEVLVESSRNGYLRRKSAQAISEALPADEACRILSRVADRESDENFLLFLADMIDSLCP